MPHEYRTDAAERARSTVLLQVRAAQRLIEAARPPSETDVHEARKAIKRARATWRLLRFCMPPRTFVATNRALRDAGRALGRARDAKVLDDTLASLVERERVSAARARRLRTRLRRPGAGWPAAAELQPRDAARARELLAGAARRVERLALSDAAPEQLAEGLARIQRRGRKAMKAARRDRSVAALHEWRKQVKNCWHAFEALPTRGARHVRAAIAAARRLSQLLGEDHDLALLHARLQRSATARDLELGASIERRRTRLQDRAFEVGAELHRRRIRYAPGRSR
jgi:CHAD domain-containing protein